MFAEGTCTLEYRGSCKSPGPAQAQSESSFLGRKGQGKRELLGSNRESLGRGGSLQGGQKTILLDPTGT